MDTTTDFLLNKQVILRQPQDGYRAAIDPVFLAAAVPVMPAASILDVGAGVGAAMLCLSARLPEYKILGIELLPDFVSLAEENILLNKWGDRLKVIQGDITQPITALKGRTFDCVISNPPFYDSNHVSLSPAISKRYAHAESSATLEVWLKFCLQVLRPKGCLILIFPVPQLGRLMSLLQGFECAVKLFPLWPRCGTPAKRVVIRAYKQRSGKVELLPGLILHEENGRYTPEAEAILRGGEGLSFE